MKLALLLAAGIAVSACVTTYAGGEPVYDDTLYAQ